jgi:hypothetical protein
MVSKVHLFFSSAFAAMGFATTDHRHLHRGGTYKICDSQVKSCQINKTATITDLAFLVATFDGAESVSLLLEESACSGSLLNTIQCWMGYIPSHEWWTGQRTHTTF